MAYFFVYKPQTILESKITIMTKKASRRLQLMLISLQMKACYWSRSNTRGSADLHITFKRVCSKVVKDSLTFPRHRTAFFFRGRC